MKPFDAPALEQALLEAQAALALARAQAGRQSWASARALEASGRLEQPVAADVLEIARLLQARRALVLVEAEAFACTRLLLSRADDPAWRPHRPWIAAAVEQLLGAIEPLRRAAAAGLQLPAGDDPEVSAVLAGNLGLARMAGGPQALQAELARLRAGAHRLAVELACPAAGLQDEAAPLQEVLASTWLALAGLRAALAGAGAQACLPDRPDSLPPAGADDLLAAWRHRLPHLQPRAEGHGDPPLPPD